MIFVYTSSSFFKRACEGEIPPIPPLSAKELVDKRGGMRKGQQLVHTCGHAALLEISMDEGKLKF